MPFSLVTKYRMKRDGVFDEQYYADRATRARRLAKAKPMLREALQDGQNKSLADAPIRDQSGKLAKQVKRVQKLSVRSNKIIFGVRVPYSPFYAGWYRRAMNQELIPWNAKMARDVVDVLVRYIEEGRK